MKSTALFHALEALEGSTLPHEAFEVAGVSYHTKSVQKGHVFVCIKGYKTDGHVFLKKAVESGAICAVVEDFQPDVHVPQLVVADTRKALAVLGDTFYDHPSQKMQMVGITATNGKTTTSYMLNAIYKNKGLKTGLIGTVAIQMDGLCIPSDLTTPESLDLQNYLGQMADAGVTHVTMEVSSSALELRRVHTVDYDIVSMNNISREHIDTHGSFEKYFDFKASLIRTASEKSAAVLNLDCPFTASLVDQTQAKVFTFGVNTTSGDIICEHLDLTTGRGHFDVVVQRPLDFRGVLIPAQRFHIQLSVPGLHSVYNAMSAITMALVSGISPDVISKGLSTFRGVERRFEFIFEEDFIIIDDHFANAGNIDVTLKTLDYMVYENLQLVYAIRGSRGPTVNRENAQMIVKWAQPLGINTIIATLSQSIVTDKDVVTDEERDVFLSVMAEAGIKVELIDELDQAIALAFTKVEKGDLILLAGCQGMDFGAEIALKQLHMLKPHIPVEQLYEPLKDRIAGVTGTV